MPKATVILLLLMVPVAHGQVVLEFGSPFQSQGATEATGQWALLLLRESDEASLHVDAVEAEGVRHTYVNAVAGVHGPLNVVMPQLVPMRPERSSPGDFEATLGASTTEWTSVLVVADRLELEVEGDASMRTAPDGTSMGSIIGQDAPWESYRFDLRVPGLGVAGYATGDRFALRAEGLQVVEWHEVSVACTRGDCPDGAQGKRTSEQTAATHTRVERYVYQEIQTRDGSVEGRGSLHGVVFGGPSVDLAVRGSVRLPDAEMDGQALGTLSLEGDMWLHGVAPAGDGFWSEVEGHYTGARIDEESVDPLRFGAIGFGVASIGVAALLYAALRHLPGSVVPLLVRDRKKALSNPNRLLLHQIITENPGATQRELHRLSGLSRSTVEKHVAVLVRVGWVVREQVGNTHRHFPNHQGIDGIELRAVAALRDEELCRLHGVLQRMGHATQSDIASHTAQAFGWAHSTTAHRLSRLVDAGLAATAQESGRRWYRPVRRRAILGRWGRRLPVPS